MSRKQNKPRKTTTSLWTEFQQVWPIGEDDQPIELSEGESWWRNSFYTVFRKELQPEEGIEGAVQLSIKRNDGKAIREWKHLQRVKNEVVGEEREAAEIFPPQSMVTSMDHEHHLFVTPVGVSSIYIYEEKVRAEGLRGLDILKGSESK
jgi:hypothetical protein